jgi:transposase
VFGNWNSIWRQFRRWSESGVWDAVLQGLADRGGELDALQMIDSTTVRAHRCAAGERVSGTGRSRGGFTTKVHLRCNAVGLFVGRADSR